MKASIVDILPAHEEHIDGIMAIERMSFKRPWREDTFLSEMANSPLSAYFVAVINKQVVGYAGLKIMVDEGHIMNVAVHPDHRRRGIGDMLVNRLIRHAQGNRITALTLEVGVLNTAAMGLYMKNGFQIGGIRKRYYGNEDAYVMRLLRNSIRSTGTGGTDNGS